MDADWVVYSKPCLARTETVVDYLGRYSHRIALADSRLLDFDGQSAQLRYQDYRDGGRRKSLPRTQSGVMTLTAEELIRRILLHVLPKGFMRVRHSGFLANRCRAQRLPEIRAALAAPAPHSEAGEPQQRPRPFDGYPCVPRAVRDACA